MKKHGAVLLAVVTFSFAAFILGLFLGRSQRREAVTVSVSKELYTLPPVTTSVPETTEAIQYPLDLNSAAAEALQSLPGIGEVLSQRIVDYREEHGPFTDTEQLMNVYGIGQQLYESIQGYITVLNEQTGFPAAPEV